LPLWQRNQLYSLTKAPQGNKYPAGLFVQIWSICVVLSRLRPWALPKPTRATALDPKTLRVLLKDFVRHLAGIAALKAATPAGSLTSSHVGKGVRVVFRFAKSPPRAAPLAHASVSITAV